MATYSTDIYTEPTEKDDKKKRHDRRSLHYESNRRRYRDHRRDE